MDPQKSASLLASSIIMEHLFENQNYAVRILRSIQKSKGYFYVYCGISGYSVKIFGMRRFLLLTPLEFNKKFQFIKR